MNMNLITKKLYEYFSAKTMQMTVDRVNSCQTAKHSGETCTELKSPWVKKKRREMNKVEKNN